jgi:hypothetical protein
VRGFVSEERKRNESLQPGELYCMKKYKSKKINDHSFLENNEEWGMSNK